MTLGDYHHFSTFNWVNTTLLDCFNNSELDTIIGRRGGREEGGPRHRGIQIVPQTRAFVRVFVTQLVCSCFVWFVRVSAGNLFFELTFLVS